MISASFLNKTATVERLSVPELQDNLGEQIKLWESYITGWRGSLQQVSANERAMLGSTGVDVTHMWLANPLNEAVTEKDRLNIGGVIYYVTGVNDCAGVGDHWELMLSETRDGGG